MKQINCLIRNLATNAVRAATLAIVVVGLLATSPMVFAQTCAFTWTNSTVYAQPGEPIPAQPER